MGKCGNCCVVLVVLVAALVGYVLSQEHPMAVVFLSAFKLQGLGKPVTEPVPSEQEVEKRPVGEMFLKLPSGARMPSNGIGMCCRATAHNDESVQRTVLWYLMMGGRHIDTAAMYMNHEAIAKGIREARAKGVLRSEMFITSKVPPDSFGYNATLQKVHRMLKELGVAYLDLVLMHMPRGFSPRIIWNSVVKDKDRKVAEGDEFKNYECGGHVNCRRETWRALSQLRAQGLIKDIGVSNFKIEHMKDLQDLSLAPISVNQLQYHPWIPQWQQKVVDYCHQHSIAVTAYFSLGGLQTKHKMLNLEVVNEIGHSHGRSAGQILLRWALEKNVSIIPGTGNPKHMRENLDVYGFTLSSKDMERIAALSDHPIADDFYFFDL